MHAVKENRSPEQESATKTPARPMAPGTLVLVYTAGFLRYTPSWTMASMNGIVMESPKRGSGFDAVYVVALEDGTVEAVLRGSIVPLEEVETYASLSKI